MQTQIQNPTRDVPVPENWRCNGAINPLIRTVEQLQKIAGIEFAEAVRCLSMKLPDDPCASPSKVRCEAELIEVARRGLAIRNTPHWHQHQEITPGARTTAQVLAKNGNLDCRAKCADQADLRECFRLMGSYNGFDASEACRVLEHRNMLQYYGPDNCNTGHEAIEYYYGWEGSHVVYLRAFWYQNRLRVLSPSWTQEMDWSKEGFVLHCQRLGLDMNADESDISEQSESVILYRLWWD